MVHDALRLKMNVSNIFINVISKFYHCFQLASDHALQMHPQLKQLLLFLNAR